MRFMNSQIGALCSKLNQFTEFMTPVASKSKTGGSRDNGERQGILGSSPGSKYSQNNKIHFFLFSGIPMLEAAMSNAAGSSMLNFASLLSGSGSTADPSIVNKMALMQMMSPNLMNGVPSAASTILQVRKF